MEDISFIVVPHGVLLHTAKVNHLNDWSILCRFLETKYPTAIVKAITGNEDDDCSGFDALPLHDYEGIVTAILTHKKALPLLMGLHQELDGMIEKQFLTKEKS